MPEDKFSVQRFRFSVKLDLTRFAWLSDQFSQNIKKYKNKTKVTIKRSSETLGTQFGFAKYMKYN